MAARAIATIVLLAAAWRSAASPQPSDSKPNFVVLFADDWGYGDLGANWKAAQGVTPNMDALANSGINFHDFHVAASVCTPSRAGLLTGRLGLRTGITHNFEPQSKAGLPVNETTIASHLKAANYRTGIIGKWHLGTMPGFSPTYHGFDEWLGLPYSDDMGCTDFPWPNKPIPPVCPKDGVLAPESHSLALPLYHSTGPNCSGQTSGSCNGDIIEQPADLSTLSGRYGTFGKQFVGAVQTDPRPFFLYVPFAHVHVPQFYAKSSLNVTGKGHFYDSLHELDRTVGTILQALKDNGIENNTLVLMTGDNGPWKVKCNLTGSAGPYLGAWQGKQGGGGSSAKTTLWEGGHRVVGLASWPGRIAPRHSYALTSSLDYFPTLSALAGLPMPSDREYDGLDLSPVLFNGLEHAHDTLFHPNSGASGPNGDLDAVRYKEFKAIWQTGGAPDCNSRGPPMRHNPPLVFDLANDPIESTPLDTSKPPYSLVLGNITAARAQKEANIASTPHTTADYSTNTANQPCCNPKHVVCRCEN